MFLNQFAKSFTVTVFDYSGLGDSTGTPINGKVDMTKGVNDLSDIPGCGKVIIGGWSLRAICSNGVSGNFP